MRSTQEFMSPKNINEVMGLMLGINEGDAEQWLLLEFQRQSYIIDGIVKGPVIDDIRSRMHEISSRYPTNPKAYLTGDSDACNNNFISHF